MSVWTPTQATAMQTLLYCLALFSDFESSNSLVRVAAAAAVPQFALMYLVKQTRTTMWEVKRKQNLRFCFDTLKQKRKNETTFMYVISKMFLL